MQGNTEKHENLEKDVMNAFQHYLSLSPTLCSENGQWWAH